MGIFKKVFGTKEEPINSNEDFWQWFQNNAKNFYTVVKNEGNIESDFFNKLSPKLNQLREGYWFLAGMLDENTAELIITADGDCKNIVFVEELVQCAPSLDNWKFTALKPALDISDVQITMGKAEFSKENLSFCPNENAAFPDDIDISIVHPDYDENSKELITNGVFIFLDNYLGELNSISAIDSVEVIGNHEEKKELIPIEKLKDYLAWRQKEFIEKYEGVRYNTENDSYSSLEATLNNDMPLFAIINTTLLDWDSKASHPWILTVEVKFKGNENGMPDEKTFDLLNDLEDKIMIDLKDSEGYLNVGRQTADSIRTIYFACKDFRLPSKVISKIKSKYNAKLVVDYDIYKDKYWRSFDRFRPEL